MHTRSADELTLWLGRSQKLVVLHAAGGGQHKGRRRAPPASVRPLSLSPTRRSECESLMCVHGVRASERVRAGAVWGAGRGAGGGVQGEGHAARAPPGLALRLHHWP
eukprot:3791518-Rhodomonas_salina.1